jgi:hypothetical protein
MDAIALAAGVFQDKPERPITASEHASVRRALSRLQKQGAVVKLGNLYQGERCSYASTEHARAIVREAVDAFGPLFFEGRTHLANLLPRGRRKGKRK